MSQLKDKSRIFGTLSGMDVVRERRSPMPKWVLPVAGVVVLGALVTWALLSLSSSHGAGTVVDGSTVVTDVAKRGTFERSISAPGTFQPEHTRIVDATQSGVVQTIFVKPGARISAGSVIAQMDNPDLDVAVTSARAQLDSARANLASVQQQARAAVLTQQASLADAQALQQGSALQAQSYRSLHAKGLVSNVQYQQAEITAAKDIHDVAINKTQIDVAGADAQAKIAAAQAQVDQAAAQLGADQAQLAALTVRAGADGIVQTVDVNPGMRIAQGIQLASVADQHDLKAVLDVPEGDVHSVLVGMEARIDTGNGVLLGHVARIAPSAQNGSVSVDVTFLRDLPGSARPSANVDGTIELARVGNAVSIARPSGATDNTTVTLFKEVDRGTRAVRIRARLGTGSSDRVQVLDGVQPGDVIIISDTSNYVDQSELRIR